MGGAISLASATPTRMVVAGPCSAETEEQIMTTAKQLSEAGIRIMRAGIWKPRTRPGGFEGAGSAGLEWLKEVKQETGMKITTEVATSGHVEECLKAGIDLLWIGARTSCDPFAVQEIADALKGVDIPVLVKNPLSPDLVLWIGALERIHNAGIRKLGAIHRGFYSISEKKYRNSPGWELSEELHRKIPEIPIIFDPSHIGGKREYIEDLSQKAISYGFNGLIIESHCTPETAWTDAAQQVTPQKLKEIINHIALQQRK